MIVRTPIAEHRWTAVCVHGFNSTALSFERKLLPTLPAWFKKHARIVFLQAPILSITCYGGQRARSWHDYLTNHGDYGVEREERIDVRDLRTSGLRIADAVIKEEVRPTFLIGESQGGCVALEAASLLDEDQLNGVILLYAQRYTHTAPVVDLPLHSFHSYSDTIIPARLAIRSLTDYTRLKMVCGMNNSHAAINANVQRFLHSSLSTLTHGAQSTRTIRATGSNMTGSNLSGRSEELQKKRKQPPRTCREEIERALTTVKTRSWSNASDRRA